MKFVPAMLSVLKLRWNIKSGGRDCLFGMWVQMRYAGLGASFRKEIEPLSNSHKEEIDEKWPKIDHDLTEKVSLDEDKFPRWSRLVSVGLLR